MTLHSIAHQTVKLAKDNSPLILTALGVAGTVTTAILTGKAAVNVERYRRDLQAERDLLNSRAGEIRYPSPDVRELFRLTWKEFVLPGASLVGTVACIICATKIGTRRAAAMAAAYSLSERAMIEYKDKVVEKFGENKERQVRDEIMQDRMITDNIGNQEIFATGNGTDLCYEKLTGRYFYCSMENIKHAVNRVNHKINRNYEASLNDFYDFLGLDNNIIGDELGWNTDKLMDVTFTTTLADGNRPCLAFNYHVEPIRDYFRHR